MGEQQLEFAESDLLVYVPASEFRRLRAAALDSVAEAETFADLCRINTLYMIACAWSGHLGTSFSSLELMSWLFLRELQGLERGPSECDVFFSSKGHDAPALYSVLIGLGLLDEAGLHRLRRLHGLPGHPHVETPYVQANTGSLGMGISKAKGMALANRILGRSRRIFVLTGDGELQEGQFWESLQSAANFGLGEITAIVDRNMVQSDTFVRDVSDLGALEAKLQAFGWRVERADGHDLRAVRDALQRLADSPGVPKVLVADTVKGKGVSFMEGSALAPGGLYAYHSGAPNEREYARASTELIERTQARFAAASLGELRLTPRARPPRRMAQTVERLVAAYSRALIVQAERHPELVVLDADLVKDCGLLEFRERFPARFVECGIAEQDMVSMACGMAHEGALPVVHSFACFLSARPHEQIYNQCSEGTKVLYAGSLAGLLPGGPGHSHQAVCDIASLAAVPHLVLVEPCTEREVDLMVDYLLNQAAGSAYLRIVSLGWPVPFALPGDYRPVEGRGVVVRDGTDVAVFGYGPWLLANAWEAATRLDGDGIGVKVINYPWLNRTDAAWLAETIGSVPHVVTLDNHYVKGGVGEMLAAAMAEMTTDHRPTVTRLGVTELPQCGTNDEVMRYHGLDVDTLTARLRDVAAGRTTPTRPAEQAR